ncbi:hypothetical protein [Teredinibacter sp. KSP-S5-2]|uniref:tetratricopeptide repeat protein n=1 Tax=Teredinibacter sp. KSP-S5-2 TaxID=3034506 RepID=UPI00293484F8|nr:hypothetical protein [Teredinibacter sp. KSP-S5-2]WNO08968.1 hypothetical protein P5V12_18640 [Teredinibacter sp. KSP-S5-2]
MGAVIPKWCRWSFVAAVLFSSTNLAAKDEPLTSVADLRYGVALYEYYQEEYMAALAELMVAKERGGINGHGDNPEIMEGGFAVGYGMERHASDIFLRLLEANRPQHVRDAAWFFLAKLRYIRNDFDGAKEALKNVRPFPSKKMRGDVFALKINLAIQQGKLKLAERYLEKRDPGVGWQPYMYYNLGAAWAREGNYTKAIYYFDEIGKSRFIDEEHVALFDQAMTAAGYAHLLLEEYPQAIEKFKKVRLNSDTSNRALLGYGWASDRLGNHNDALDAWTHLSNSNLLDASNQEAVVAVPFAYERLGAETLALRSFKEAEQKLLAEIDSLDKIIVDMQNDKLIDVLRIKRSHGLDWLRYAEENDLAPQLSYLVQLFSRDEFQSSVLELRDLLAIKEDMQLWKSKLNFYMAMVNSREFERAKRAEALAENDLFGEIGKLVKQRSELTRKIETTAAEKDYFALASGNEAELIERIKRVQRNIELLRETDPFIDEYDEAARRYYGILLWESSEKFSDRMWRVVKTLSSLDETIRDVRKKHKDVEAILAEAEDLEPYKVTIQQLQSKIDHALVQVDMVLEKNKASIRYQIVEILNIQRGRLTHYLAQSRLAMARILDRATRGEGRRDIEAYESTLTAPGDNPGDNGDGQPVAAEKKAPKKSIQTETETETETETPEVNP